MDIIFFFGKQRRMDVLQTEDGAKKILDEKKLGGPGPGIPMNSGQIIQKRIL